MRSLEDLSFVIHGFLYQLCILYALDIIGRLDETELYRVLGTGVLLCLLLTPTAVVDFCFRLGTCLLLMRDNYLWLMNELIQQTGVAGSQTIGERLNTYKLCSYLLPEQSVNISLYTYIMGVLLVFLLVVMAFRLLIKHIQTKDKWVLASIILQIMLYLATSSTSIYFRGISILIPHIIISWFFCRLFRFHDYMQGVICSLFLSVENLLLAVAIFLSWSIVYGFKIIREPEQTPFSASSRKKPDMGELFQKQYRKTLFACLLYAIFNLFSAWILNHSTFLTEPMTVFSDSWVGKACFICLIFFTSRAVMVFTVYYLRGFDNVRIRFSNPGFSDVWIIIFLIIQSSNNESNIHGLDMTIGVIMMSSKLLNEIHDLSEPVLMELIAYKGLKRRQILVFTYFTLVSVSPFLLYCVFSETLDNLDTWLFRVIIVGLMNTTIECLSSVLFYFILRLSIFRSNLEIYTNLILLLYCWSNLVYILFFILWCVSSVHSSIIGTAMPILMFVYIGDQGQIIWQTIKQRNLKIRRLRWRPSEWDKQLVDNGSSCSICLCKIDLNALNFVNMPSCKHRFHESCIEKWCGFDSKCPLCRQLSVGRSVGLNSRVASVSCG